MHLVLAIRDQDAVGLCKSQDGILCHDERCVNWSHLVQLEPFNAVSSARCVGCGGGVGNPALVHSEAACGIVGNRHDIEVSDSSRQALVVVVLGSCAPLAGSLYESRNASEVVDAVHKSCGEHSALQLRHANPNLAVCLLVRCWLESEQNVLFVAAWYARLCFEGYRVPLPLACQCPGNSEVSWRAPLLCSVHNHLGVRVHRCRVDISGKV